MRHDFVRLSRKTDVDLCSGGTTITFETEEADTGDDHAPGKAAIIAPYNCTMSGVVQVNGVGRYSIVVKRYDENGDVMNSESYDESRGGWTNSPFSSIWSKGQSARVVLTALDPGAMASAVRIYCDIHER